MLLILEHITSKRSQMLLSQKIYLKNYRLVELKANSQFVRKSIKIAMVLKRNCVQNW